MKLYASKHGGRYHQDPECGLTYDARQALGGLPRAWTTITATEARKRALTPCRVCRPPVLLTVITGDGAEW